MEKYLVGQRLAEIKCVPEGEAILLLFTSEEMDKKLSIPKWEESLCHMPAVRDAHVCKAEIWRDCLYGTVVTPRYTQQEKRIAFSYLITGNMLAICDDSGVVYSLVRHLAHEKCNINGSTGRILYEIVERLVSKDLHHLEELEDQMVQIIISSWTIWSVNRREMKPVCLAMKKKRFFTYLRKKSDDC